MALALYRKYRPAKFAEVVGQEHVTEPLSTALAAGRINHAYLFSGPRGCGKTSSARILARSLNCELGPTPDPCGVCPSCISLAPGGPGNIDVTELDAASHGGVDDTRELRDRAFFAPAESRYRVFIVDEAHMITTQGFNALLKIVEEPPDHLVFVFATTEPDKVLTTIRSRTHHYPFRLIPPSTLRGLLERICADEGATIAPAVFPLVLRAGGGSARDSLSILDQLLAGAGEGGVTYERAVALLGVTDVALIDDMVDALAANDRAAVFETVDRLVEAGHDPRRFAADLLQRLRDLTLLQAVPDAAQRGLVEAAADEVARMLQQADRIGPAALTRYGEIVHTGLTEMRGATAPRLLLELLCARMLLPAATTDEPGLLERLERLERRNAISPAPPVPGESVADDPGRRRFARPSERRGQPADDRPAADQTPGGDHPEPGHRDTAGGAGGNDRSGSGQPATAIRGDVSDGPGRSPSDGPAAAARVDRGDRGAAAGAAAGDGNDRAAAGRPNAGDRSGAGAAADRGDQYDQPRSGDGAATGRGDTGTGSGPRAAEGRGSAGGRSGSDDRAGAGRGDAGDRSGSGDRAASARGADDRSVRSGSDDRAGVGRGGAGDRSGSGDRAVSAPGAADDPAGRSGSGDQAGAGRDGAGDRPGSRGPRERAGAGGGSDRSGSGAAAGRGDAGDRTGSGDRAAAAGRSGPGDEVGAGRADAGDRPGSGDRAAEDDRYSRSGSTDLPAAPRGGPSVPAAPPPPAPANLDAAAVRRAWPEVLAQAKERKKRTAALLVSATVRAVENDTLVLSIGTAPLARLLSEQSNTDVIAEALHAVFGVRWRVRCEHGDGGSPPPAPPRGDPGPGREPPVRRAPEQPAAPRRPQRPAPTRRSTAPEDGVPLPPEPPDEDAPPEDDEESMIAEAAADTGGSAPRRDPEEAAIELLSSQLGARTLDDRPA